MIVIADDITGAAEIAAIAKKWGYKTSLMVFQLSNSCNLSSISTAEDECLVVATNTRSLSSDCAIQAIKALADRIRVDNKTTKQLNHQTTKQPNNQTTKQLNHQTTKQPNNQTTKQLNHQTTKYFIFKKVDSALRGHVVEEIDALKKTLEFKDILYIPCNPSKGRIIKDGVYYINDKPLNETDFSHDPEFPAHSASLTERFPSLHYKDATTTDEIKAIIDNIPAKDLQHTLLTGAADLFECLCRKLSCGELCQNINSQIPVVNEPSMNSVRRVKILLGSTQSNEKAIDIVAGHKMTFCPMPESVFVGTEDTSWAKGDNVCLYYPQHRNGNPSWLTGIMARTLKRNIEEDPEFASSSLLIIEGGASAFAALATLEWKALDVIGELAPGVAVLKHNNTLVILKPGSYPWGKALQLIN